MLRCLCCSAAEVKQAASSGWLSRLWKRSDTSPPGAVKANLGDQSSFYFDKELGKWVNKNVSFACSYAFPSPVHVLTDLCPCPPGECDGVKTCCPASACADRIAEQVDGRRPSPLVAHGRRTPAREARNGRCYRPDIRAPSEAANPCALEPRPERRDRSALGAPLAHAHVRHPTARERAARWKSERRGRKAECAQSIRGRLLARGLELDASILQRRTFNCSRARDVPSCNYSYIVFAIFFCIGISTSGRSDCPLL